VSMASKSFGMVMVEDVEVVTVQKRGIYNILCQNNEFIIRIGVMQIYVYTVHKSNLVVYLKIKSDSILNGSTMDFGCVIILYICIYIFINRTI